MGCGALTTRKPNGLDTDVMVSIRKVSDFKDLGVPHYETSMSWCEARLPSGKKITVFAWKITIFQLSHHDHLQIGHGFHTNLLNNQMVFSRFRWQFCQNKCAWQMFDDFKLNVVKNHVLLIFPGGVGNPTTIWRFPQMGGTPISSILIGFSMK